ncbi:MAG: ABC transporter ATP-binding protein [Clostridia bacterium]|nr:ABC transporter ATP-binding protein [Clostridia bacterium]NCC44081.1 ABC transporter ATP-binding protein [Clostridia bacterium]
MEEDNVLVQGLCKSFAEFALDNVSFHVPKGRIVGFIGENGAGKSTTIKLILNELKRDAGKVYIFGEENTRNSFKKDIGLVLDECNFHECFTAKVVGKMLSRIYSSWDQSLYMDYLDKFKIPTDKQIGTFSKGMKMKLSIICAMVHKAKLLIMDEATSGLDPVVRDEILDMFLDFIQDEECSIFFSSHITSDIQKIADYVVLIHQGKIIFEEQKDDLIYNYGILRCRDEDFSEISPDDYIVTRKTNVSIECLVKDKENARKKYQNAIVDTATLEDIMLFYIKGESLCED